MLYALIRADGSIAITTQYPLVVIHDGVSLQVTAVDGVGNVVHASDPEGGQSYSFPFEGHVQDLDVESIPNCTLVFREIGEEVSRMPVPTDYVSWHQIKSSKILPDRTFRDAWSYTVAASVHVDMPKARNIHRNKIRAARAPLLAALDIEYQRADEADDVAAKRAIAIKKQRLRDATEDQRIAAAATPEQLKAVWPEALR